MVGVRGDFAALRRLSVQIAGIARPEFKNKLGARLGATAITQVVRGFQGQRDPYGNAWQALKHRKGQILRDTGRLANGFSGSPTATGFRIFSKVAYAGAHQYGATIPPHTRLGTHTLLINPKTNRIISATKARKMKLIYTHTYSHQTLAKGITIPKRQMVPEPSTGGVGQIWGAAFNRDADAIMREQVGK